jgi:hypothetical protein
MFLAICKACGRRELRGLRGITALVNTDRGIELHFVCRACGEHGIDRAGVGADVVPLPAVVSSAA